MSQYDDKSFKIGKLCISSDDYYMIIINILLSVFLICVFYIKKVSENSNNFSVLVRSNFTLLGEGQLSNFYSPLSLGQKNPSTKKKVQTKAGNQATAAVEKTINNNELKCNSCGRSVEVSYQYTMHKLNSNC